MHGLRPAVPIAVVIATSLLSTATAVPQQTISPGSARLLDTAKLAIGIKPKTQGPSSLRLTGTGYTSQVVSMDESGRRRVTEREDPIEVLVAFPDGYLEIGLTGPFERRRGFKATRVILRTIGLTPGAQVSSGSSSSDIAPFRRDLTRLAVGMLARTDTLPGLIVSEGGSNAVRFDENVSAPQPLAATLEFDPVTNLPLRLIWRVRTRVLVPGTILGSGDGGGAGPVGPETPEETLTMSFNDRRDVSGFKLPFRITTAAKGITLSELRFERIEVNPRLTDEDFQ